MDEIELPLVGVLREMELLGVRLNLERLAEITAPRARGDRRARTRDLRARRRGVPDRLAAAARGDPVREARPLAQAPRQDRLLDRRARAAGDPLRARDRAEDRALARALDADQDLPRRAPRAGRRALAHPHHLPAGGRPDGPPVEHQPEHAERPDPHAARARDPRLLRGRGGQRADLRRLLPDRAARARPRRRGARADGDLPARRGRPHGDRLAGLRGRRRRTSTRACARRPR